MLKLRYLTSLAVAALILVKGISVVGWTKGYPLIGFVVVILSMIWFDEFWAKYILPLSFWASKAKDFDNPEASAPAIVFLGWVFLLLFYLGVSQMHA